MKLSFIVDSETAGKTVKHVLKTRLELSERLVKRLKYSSRILCNSIPVRVNVTVNPGDIIEVDVDFIEENEAVIPENIGLDVVYEDECIIAVNKRPFIVVHPTSTHPSGTVANAVMYHLQLKGITKKIRPVSRLDRDTTGIIIFAMNEYTQEFLIRQMNGKTFIKEYIGIVHGTVIRDSGTIDLPIERKPGSIMLRHISQTGDTAITHYDVIERLNNATLLKFTLETGRTHQIRVHCQAIGHPLIGDTFYSDIPTTLIGRQALHSHKAGFFHPMSGSFMELSSPIPEDMRLLLEIFKK